LAALQTYVSPSRLPPAREVSAQAVQIFPPPPNHKDNLQLVLCLLGWKVVLEVDWSPEHLSPLLFMTWEGMAD
jgi:hypothetical protein